MWAWPQIENARCLNNGISMFAGAVLNTISEFIVACLPIPLVFTLGMSQGQRYSVISLLSLGLLVVVCGVLRTHYIWLTYENHDPAWWAGPHWICSEVEIDTAIVSIIKSVPANNKMLIALVDLCMRASFETHAESTYTTWTLCSTQTQSQRVWISARR